MIGLTATATGFDDVIAMLNRLARPDLKPLATRCQAVMVEDNRAGLLAGTDADGSETEGLRPSTLRRRTGDGPPRVPQGESSRAIANYGVEIQAVEGGFLLVGAWRDFDAIRYMNNRHMIGIRPEGEALLQQATDDATQDLIGGRS